MSSNNKKYWSTIGELEGNEAVNKVLQQREFAQEIPIEDFLSDKKTLDSSKTSRRDFLKFVGFSTAAASLAACEGPVIKSVPYVVQPENIIPGVANYYATTMADGFDFSHVLVKTREARPIRVDKNKMSGYTSGTNARVLASVLSLYDYQRLQQPMANGEETTWDALDEAVQQELDNVNGEIVLLTRTFASPTTEKAIREFSSRYNARHVVYDTISEDPTLDAFQAKYGRRALPTYDFANAKTIVSIGADIVGNWQGGGYNAPYAHSRNPEGGNMSRHIQFEANMSTTGANADKRILTKPSEQKQVLVALYNRIVKGFAGNDNLPEHIADAVAKATTQLKEARDAAVVVTDIPEMEAQLLAFEINEALGSKIFIPSKPRLVRKGNSKQVAQLVKDMNAGKIGALLVADVNPAYSLPNAQEFLEGLEKVQLSIAFSMKEDETAAKCRYIATTPHYLESWGDVQFTDTDYSLVQPTIRTLFNTRQFEESLLTWAGEETNYYDYLKENWEQNILSGSSWNSALHDGLFQAAAAQASNSDEDQDNNEEEENEDQTPASSVNSDTAAQKLAAATDASGEFELALYTSIALGDGRQANNPWLQELPDPITRSTWDNFITMSKADADRLGVKNRNLANGALNGSYVNLTAGEVTFEKVPVMIQPGQAPGTIGLALGYGRRAGIQKEMQTGINAYPLYKDFKNFQHVDLELAKGEHEFALVQLQNTMVGRNIIQEVSLEDYINKPQEEWNPVPTTDHDHEQVSVRSHKVDLWTSFDDTIGHHFNMSIDLNACTGCGACVIACHTENNVPVVGKTEVRKFRDMHWMRIDRYYASEDTFKEEKQALKDLPAFKSYKSIETPSYENPQVAFQPVMCQHCNHAPCETVCPVAAITHGRQGQNQMIYNRCVGTRYCANNCPYKVRRFNWFKYKENDEFDYNMNNDLGRMVLNPDVTVRSRGVMEKCSLCIQITQQTILEAKRDGRAMEDGEFYTACSIACEPGAITFGDVNIEGSEISKKRKDKRMYRLLESLGTKPNVMYQTKVINLKDA